MPDLLWREAALSEQLRSDTETASLWRRVQAGGGGEAARGVVAAYFPDDRVSGFFQRRISIGPDEAAVVIRDGRIVDTYHQKKLAAGGVWAWVKSLFGVEHSYRLLIVNLSPFPTLIPFGAGASGGGAAEMVLSRDRERVTGTLKLTLQVNFDRVHNLLGVMRGANVLFAGFLAEQVRDEVVARVLLPLIAEHDAKELRANVALQDKVQAEVFRVVERFFGDLGFFVRSATVNWAATEEDQVGAAVRDLERSRALAQAEARDRQAATRDQHEVLRLDRELEDSRDIERQTRLHQAELQRQMAAATGEVERKRVGVEMAKLDLEIQRLGAEQRLSELARVKEIERQDRQAHLEMKRQDDTERERAAAAVEADRATGLKDLSADRILALSAAKSASASAALAEKFKAEAVAAKEGARAAEKGAERMQEQAARFGDQMAQVAASAARGGAKCPGCGRETSPAWRACPYCAAKLA
ncbi:MAG: hypothetical protein HY719_14255 [Planctomycetes bacterium]|nr:hypothetical protein [Planctomycetota bacterium]